MHPKQKRMASIRVPNQINSKGELFFYLTILTGLFFLLQVSYLVKFSGFYLGDVDVITSHLGVPARVIPPVLFFILIQILLHVLLVVMVWAQAILVGRALDLSWKNVEKIGFYLWGFTLAALIFSNQYYFPNSKFSSLTEGLVSHSVAGVLSFIFDAVLAIVFCVAMYGFFKIISRLFMVILISVCCFGIYHVTQRTVNAFHDTGSVEKPNVIIIGIDSLRPDYLGFFGSENNTPHLDDFLNHATVFADSLTPIARTFPAWVSILTGKYPIQSGARTNLEALENIDLRATLPKLLQQQGYTTIFATDETRFSNIDQRFGFDKVVTPPIGVNDFLIGVLNDFPISNLLVNTTVGKWLFPYNYGNRPALATYDPDSFLNLLKPVLAQPRQKPLFLAVHFCLPHYPYYWGTAPLVSKSIRNYQAAINRVDQQFYDFIKILQQDKLLEHSVVILLSDHGEAIELHGDRATDPDLYIAGENNPQRKIPKFYPPMLETEKVDESAGHGTDVLGLTQYHTVLAMRTFGLVENKIQVLPGRVSLLDIKPTILDMLSYPLKHESGRSLKAVLLGKKSSVNVSQDFFTESDFSPQAIRTVHPEERDVMFEGINYFQIDPVTTRVTVKPDMEKMIISSKQLAVFRGEWVLALYPQDKQKMKAILVNLKTGNWTDDLKTDFALQSPADDMLIKLHQFYRR